MISKLTTGVRDQKAAGSNPATSTILTAAWSKSKLLFFYIFISKKPLFQGFSGWIYTNQRLTEPAMRRYVWRMPRMAMEYAWMFSGKAMPP